MINRLLYILVFFSLPLSCEKSGSPKATWPEITMEAKPWTRWWWPGSAVTKEGITAELEAFKEAGLGGVEVTPIYGVYGSEENFIDYLSPQWMEMLEHTLLEADRLGLGVDMATGTGWPFGGPWVGDEDACKDMSYRVYELRGGESIDEPIVFPQKPFVRSVGMQIYEMHGIYKVEGQTTKSTISEPLLKAERKPLNINDLVEPVSANKNLQALALDQVKFDKQLFPAALMGYGGNSEMVNLMNKLDNNHQLNWVAPAGRWKVYAVFPGWHGKMVERAAPGGEGNVIDHFSKQALENYLQRFDTAFNNHNIKSLRAFFNDSYEVDDARGSADWTPDLFAEFQKRRKYDLLEHLPALFGEDEQEKNERVLCDYRETISELIYDNFTSVWKTWANGKGKIVRNQAHGSPSNILDLYAEVDIPEMEGTDILRIKMASSAANVSGKKLASSESATWLNEHFVSNLGDIKESLDRFMVSGVNHIFYHGTCYSPQDDPWPGWLFYAAVHLNPRNPLWKDFSKLNEYVARCQSLLQRSTPANDVLLYFPIYDRFSTPGNEMIEHFDGVDRQFEGTPFKESAEILVEKGFTFDYISDKQIRNLEMESGLLKSSPDSYYKVVLIPQSKYIHFETFKSLMKLANAGATVLIYKDFPESVPGFLDSQVKEGEYKNDIDQLSFVSSETRQVEEAQFGKGRFLRCDDLSKLMEEAGVKRESLVDSGLQFLRKKTNEGHLYFLANWSKTKIDGWVPLSADGRSVVMFNPMHGSIGLAKTRVNENDLSVYLQLERGESMIIQVYDVEVSVPLHAYVEDAGNAISLTGKWQLRINDESQGVTETIELDTLTSWTSLSSEQLKKFSGTGEYKISFPRPDGNYPTWLLDLGVVKESARVLLNGDPIATLIGPSYSVLIDNSKLVEENTLTIEVSNLMANRIANMDQQDVFWKKFYNVNFPARLADNRKNGLFDASHWEPKDSGLLGPVTLTGQAIRSFD